MLSRGDDYPIHQRPEPVAFAGTDRNFYDRYFFNGYTPDGSLFFAAALGIYPHLNIADAHFCVVRDGVQHCLHASRVLHMERMDLTVGPITIVVDEPLQRLRVIVRETDGIAADIVFEGRAFPVEEPRFTHRIGPRTFLDYTRMTQNGRYSGWISVDGQRTELPGDCVGTRDRSWGVRPVGASDAQPHAPAVMPGFFWQWTPLNFAGRSLFFHVNADAHGDAFNLRAVVVADGAAAAAQRETSDAAMASANAPGTRWPSGGTLTIRPGGETELVVRFEPLLRFQMRGLGYVSAAWGHGLYKGELAVEREDIDLAAIDPTAIENLHVQMLCRVALEQPGEATEQGVGVFEQLVLGPYAPMGFAGLNDPAR